MPAQAPYLKNGPCESIDGMARRMAIPPDAIEVHFAISSERVLISVFFRERRRGPDPSLAED
jgi:hypothetical protein